MYLSRERVKRFREMSGRPNADQRSAKPRVLHECSMREVGAREKPLAPRVPPLGKSRESEVKISWKEKITSDENGWQSQSKFYLRCKAATRKSRDAWGDLGKRSSKFSPGSISRVPTGVLTSHFARTFVLRRHKCWSALIWYHNTLEAFYQLRPVSKTLLLLCRDQGSSKIKMPLVFLEQLPLPSLQSYVTVSVLVFVSAILYALNVTIGSGAESDVPKIYDFMTQDNFCFWVSEFYDGFNTVMLLYS